MAERVILFSVDGMRPEGLLQANAPTMQDLMKRGAYSLAAQTVMPSVTLPTHMSMFHGVLPALHGVTSNDWRPQPDCPIPGITEVVRQAKRKTAAFYNWEQLRDLSRPGALTHSGFIDIYGPDGAASDENIASLAADFIVRERPDFTFIYLGLTDEIGHHYGWLSEQYLTAIAGADAAIGHVLESLESAGLLGDTACIVTSDHGGHEKAHGSDLPEDMTIPWLLAGPGVKQNYSITGAVRIYDTAPSIAHLLGLAIPKSWQGRPVTEAFE